MSGGEPTQCSSLAEFQRGQSIKPAPVQEKSFATSVADVMHDVIPQSSSGSPRTDPERVEWVSFEHADITDPSLKLYFESVVGSEVPVLMVLGLARGYHIWALLSNGDCEELVSDRQGPVKTVKFLPEPLPFLQNPAEPARDQFINYRPLIAVVDSVSASPGRQHCSLSILSLANGDAVHSLRFDEPIAAVEASKRALVVSFSGRIAVFDTMKFSELFTLNGCAKSDEYHQTPFSLGDTWLAYSDSKLTTQLQSCGGVMGVVSEQLPVYATHVMSAAKNLSKTMSAFGDSVASSLGAKVKGPRGPAQQEEDICGVVTVINVASFPESQGNISRLGTVAHFPALSDESIGALRFSHNSSLLLVVGESGHYFQIFSILSHPGSPALSAVHHVYTLFRGSTPAKVVDSSFSLDARWVALATNHGTTHVFPITPYGGPINMRTHGGAKLVNRESRFYRTAGLDLLELQGSSCSTSPVGSGSPATTANSSDKSLPSAKDTHPSLSQSNTSLAKVSGNTRLPPYPVPTMLTALGKIRQQLLGSLSSWAPDLSSRRGSSGAGAHRQPKAVRKLALTFGRERGWKALVPGHSDSADESLFILNSENLLVEYALNVRPQQGGAQGAKVSDETPVEMIVTPTAQWTLQRTKSSPDLRPPLPKQHPLMLASSAAKRSNCSRVHIAEKSSKVFTAKPTSPSSVLTSFEALTVTPKGNQTPPTTPPFWLAQVEIVTYSGPSRRLWTGPQFTFRTYFDPSHSATNLVSPDSGPNSHRSDPMPMPGGKTGLRLVSVSSSLGSGGASIPIGQHSGPGSTYRSVPVVIEANSGSFERRRESVTMEVCGSWSDNDFISMDEQEGRVREGIADAMQENRCHDLRRGPMVTIASNMRRPSPLTSSTHSNTSSTGVLQQTSAMEQSREGPGPTNVPHRERQESQGSGAMEDARSSLSDSVEEDEDDDESDEPNLLFPDLDYI